MLKFYLIVLAPILICCYSSIKNEDSSKSRKIMEHQNTAKIQRGDDHITIKYSPSINSEIQVQYYFYYKTDIREITHINFSGYLARYVEEKDLYYLDDEFQIDSSAYRILLKDFQRYNFLSYVQYHPRQEHMMFEPYGLVISFREEDEKAFKNLLIYLPIDSRYTSKGFNKLYSNLLSTSKDSRFVQ
jgi:hypothetical protein